MVIYLFHSFDFIFFLIFVLFLYWILPQRFRNSLLLLASYLFYGSWSKWLLIPLIVSTFVDYFCGQLISASHTKSRKKLFLLVSIVTNLSLLGFFKYFNFFADNLIRLLNTFGLNFNFTLLNIILPIGISFYTFQKLSYTIDIYRGKIHPTKNIIDFALFVAYFPQLIAGPIERARNLIPRIQTVKFLKKMNFREGIYLFIYGLFKKVVLADSVALVVEKIFALSDPSGAQILVATYAFAIQIYCDFSGYSNMARGISHFFGIKLSTNFNLPYFAKNPVDFWRRWHITLSKWVRDYIYIPLGGKYKPFLGLVPLLISWSLMGLWHGAAWNFVLWGLFWFLLIFGYRLYKKYFAVSVSIKNSFLRILTTIFMFHITCYSWILFRAENLSQFVDFTGILFHGLNLRELFNLDYFFIYVIMIFLIVYELIQYKKGNQLFMYRKGFYYQLIFYFILFIMAVEIGTIGRPTFIYFQF